MRTLSTSNDSEINNNVTDELFVIDIGFATPLRISSRNDVIYDSLTYTGVNKYSMSLSTDGMSGRVSFFDESFSVTPDLISEGTGGISVTVRAVYGRGTTFAAADADTYFVGELGRCTLENDKLTLLLVPPAVKFLPSVLIDDKNGFSHLPPDGTKISTPNGIIVLERK